MPSRSLKRLAALLALSAAMPVIAEPVPYVDLLGKFVQAKYAMTQCGKAEPDTEAMFAENFKVVAARTMDEMKANNPNLSPQQIAYGMKLTNLAAERVPVEIIRSKGCADPRIQGLVGYYVTLANLSL